MKTNTVICCMALVALAIVATGAWAEEVWTFDDGLGDWEQEGDGPTEDPGLGFFFVDTGVRSWLCNEGGKLIWTNEADVGRFGVTYLRAPNLPLAGNEFFVVSINATGVAGLTLEFAARTLPSNVVNIYTTVLQDGLNVYSFDITTEAEGTDDEINLIRLGMPGAGIEYEIDWCALAGSASFVPATQDTSCGEGDAPAIPAITPSSPYAIADESFSLTAPGDAPYQWYYENVLTSGKIDQVLAFDPVTEGDIGLYSVTFDDGEGKAEDSATYDLFVYPAETEVPLTGLLGLGLLAGACALGGAAALRRKR